MSLYATVVMPSPDLGRANHPRFATSAASFSLSANNVPKFADGSIAVPEQKPLWIKTIPDSASLDFPVSGMLYKLIAKISLPSLIDITEPNKKSYGPLKQRVLLFQWFAHLSNKKNVCQQIHSLF